MERQLLSLLDYDLRVQESDLELHLAPFLKQIQSLNFGHAIRIEALRLPSLRHIHHRTLSHPRPRPRIHSPSSKLPTSHHHCITPPRRHNSYPLRESTRVSLKPSIYNTPITPMSILTPSYNGSNNVVNFPQHLHASIKNANNPIIVTTPADNKNSGNNNEIFFQSTPNCIDEHFQSTPKFIGGHFQSTPNCIDEHFPDNTSDDSQVGMSTDMDTDEDEENHSSGEEKRVVYDEPTLATFDELCKRYIEHSTTPSTQWNCQTLPKSTSPSTIANANLPDAGVLHFPSYCSGHNNKM
ncbi:3332_t:CDS:2, partial [Acaulospora morrowiae]